MMIAYFLLVSSAMTTIIHLVAGQPLMEIPLLVWMLLGLNLAALIWRASLRFAFTSRDYGPVEGLMAVIRIPIANIIAIMAARRAIQAYICVLAGQKLHWDKTDHDRHPASASIMQPRQQKA
ncbi:MAG: hypothetical protein ACK5NN_08005 [Sphingomonadaceae bacterium]